LSSAISFLTLRNSAWFLTLRK